MTGFIIFLVLFLLLGYYASFLLTIRSGLRNTVRPTVRDTPFVSVLVATRNEQHTIGINLRSLISQDYPRDRFEIIVIDDHSTDGTIDQVRPFENSQSPEIRLITLERGGVRLGKPAAITAGVEQSKGDIILSTDADCVVPPTWLKSMAGCFDTQVAFAAGPVLETPAGSLLGKLQSLEFLGLITTAAGLIGAGKPIICNGANIAYRKSAFMEVQGYGGNSTSCDDETLMQRMISRNMGKVVFNADPEAVVRTTTPATISAFWHQRTRWAAKRGRYEDTKILARLVTVYAFFVLLLIASLFTVLEPRFILPFGLVVATKMLLEYSVLRSGARLLLGHLSVLHFLVAEIFHVPYIVLAAFVGQFTSIRWKERRLEQ